MSVLRLRRTLPPDLRAVDRFCAEVGRWLVRQSLSAEVFAVLMLLHESLTNAVVHGCRRCAEKRVRCEVRRGNRRISISVQDDGPGFARTKRNVCRRRTSARHGRGLQIYRLYADRVVFNGRGNRVLLSRKISGG